MKTANRAILSRLSLIATAMVLLFGSSACAVVPGEGRAHHTSYVADHNYYVTSDRPQVRHVAQRDVVVHKTVQTPVYVQNNPHGGRPEQAHRPSVSQKRPDGHNSGNKYTPSSHQRKQEYQDRERPGKGQSNQGRQSRDDRPVYSQASHNQGMGPQSHAPGSQGGNSGRGRR